MFICVFSGYKREGNIYFLKLNYIFFYNIRIGLYSFINVKTLEQFSRKSCLRSMVTLQPLIQPPNHSTTYPTTGQWRSANPTTKPLNHLSNHLTTQPPIQPPNHPTTYPTTKPLNHLSNQVDRWLGGWIGGYPTIQPPIQSPYHPTT